MFAAVAKISRSLPQALLLWLCGTVGSAAPLDERQLARLWIDSPALDGQAIQLTAGDSTFVGLFQLNTRGTSRGGVIVLHDRAANADSIGVVRTLRLGLARAGWDTLALQLPHGLASEDRQQWLARYADRVSARLQAALAWLRAREIAPLSVIAQGDTAAIVLPFLRARPPEEVAALVMIDAALADDVDTTALEALRAQARPVLDIYPQRGLDRVVSNAALRARFGAANQTNPYRQRELAEARPDFVGSEDQLLAAVRAWLSLRAAPPP